MAESSPDFRLSVVVRTQGLRPAMLSEALASLAAQTDQAFEVLLMVHGPSAGVVSGDVVPQALASQTKVEAVLGGGRARPLNHGLELASGTHLAFLDDDDVAYPNWVATFHAGADRSPGAVIRAVTADVPIREVAGAPGYEVVGEPAVPEGRLVFDLVSHVSANATPICAFAAPLAEIRRLGVRFDERLAVLEDYALFLEAAYRLGVHDTGEVTSLYRRWEGAGSWDTVDRQVWSEARAAVIERLSEMEGVAPPGTIPSIARVLEESESLRGRVADTIRVAAEERASLRAQLRDAVRERDQATRLAERMRRSLSWRATAPLRALRRGVPRSRRGGR